MKQKEKKRGGQRTFLLSHFLEVVGADQRDAGLGPVWGLLLHVDLKVLLTVLEGALLRAVLPPRRRTLDRPGTQRKQKLHGENYKKILFAESQFVYCEERKFNC